MKQGISIIIPNFNNGEHIFGIYTDVAGMRHKKDLLILCIRPCIGLHYEGSSITVIF